MMPQPVKLGVVHCAACLPLASSHTRTSPMRFPAARYFPSLLNATLCTGGTWAKLCFNSPVFASYTRTEGSRSGSGSYLYPPQMYCPVTDATSEPSADRAICQDQNLCAETLRIVFFSAASCH